jgi:hypothetical protein
VTVGIIIGAVCIALLAIFLFLLIREMDRFDQGSDQ